MAEHRAGPEDQPAPPRTPEPTLRPEQQPEPQAEPVAASWDEPDEHEPGQKQGALRRFLAQTREGREKTPAGPHLPAPRGGTATTIDHGVLNPPTE